MTWKRHKQTSTRRTWYTTVLGWYMIQLTSSGGYECWTGGGEFIGSAGLLGGAKNLCETHAKGGR